MKQEEMRHGARGEGAGRLRAAVLALVVMIGLCLSIANVRADDSASLLWQKSFGETYGTSYSDGPTPPAIAAGDLYVANGKTLSELDVSDGSVLRTTALDASSCYATIPLTYDAGTDQLYAALGTMDGWSVKDGMIEAVSRASMTKAWSTALPDGGQVATPVTSDGVRVYAATWGASDGSGSYYALDASDGSVVWTVTDPAGFYNAGACVQNGVVYFCSEQDRSGASRLYAVRAADGTNVQEPVRIEEQVRSQVVTDGAHVFFVSGGAKLCRYDIASDGTLSNVKTADLSGAATSLTLAGGKLYIGTSAKAIDVIDAASMAESASATGLPGYPQGKMAVRTNADGTVTVDTTYNYTPGGLYRVTFQGGAVKTQGDLFVPAQDAQNYCLSPVVEKDGVLYYKNDSFRIFAVKMPAQEAPSYHIVRGGGQTWTKGSGSGLSMTADGPIDKFAGIEVDGSEVANDQYDAAAGSTVITLEPAYLETLAAGRHTLTVKYTDGEASGTFTVGKASAKPDDPGSASPGKGKGGTVAGSPKTGDTADVAGFAALIAGAAVLIGVTRRAGRREK